MTVEERRGYWERQVATQLASGLSVRTWCRQAGVVYGTFSYWRRRVQIESPLAPVRLIPVVDEAPSAAGLCIVVGALPVLKSSGTLTPTCCVRWWRRCHRADDAVECARGVCGGRAGGPVQVDRWAGPGGGERPGGFAVVGIGLRVFQSVGK